MTCGCNEIVEAVSGSGLSYLAAHLVWWNMFLMGLAGSFGHCIAMCGPIALAQTALRCAEHQDAVGSWKKLQLYTAIPYYLGKGITYVLLTVLFFLSTDIFKGGGLIWQKVLTIIAIGMSINSIIQQFYPQNSIISGNILGKKSLILLNKIKLKATGYQGLLLGMLLGLIPCHLVYAMISSVIAQSGTIGVAVIGAAMFALGTVPGLLLVAYSGAMFYHRYRSLVKVLYFLAAVGNLYLLSKLL